MDPVSESYKFISSCEEPATFDLITAASVGDMRLVQKFLNESTNPNITNTSGWTALMYAANYGHYNILRVLVDWGADVNLQEWVNGRTALMFAASNGHTRCVEVLVHYGKANINQLDYAGKIAAYYATHFGHGNNKIIGKMLGITDARNSRAITKVVKKPKIMITQTNGVTEEVNRTPLQFGDYQSPIMPFYHFATIKDGGSNGSKNTPHHEQTNGSNGHQNNNGHNGHYTFNIPHNRSVHDNHNGPGGYNDQNGLTVSEKVNEITPVLQISSSLAVRRKRLILSNGSISGGVEQIGSAGKTGSPPLPNTLEQLLSRLGLDEYKALFTDNSIDLYVFLTLTDKDLKEVGIKSIGHRKRLTAAQQRFRESIEIRNTQERFFADWLLNEREQLKLELEAMRAANNTLSFRLQELESKM